MYKLLGWIRSGDRIQPDDDIHEAMVDQVDDTRWFSGPLVPADQLSDHTEGDQSGTRPQYDQLD